MSYDIEDTICAVASPPGGGARGIVRLSGPRAIEVASAVFRPAAGAALDCRVARVYRGEISLTQLQRELPAALYLWPGRFSYTREPAAELHTLGSPPLLAATLAELGRHGARPAAPGEFTLRAFLAGRIDLTQAEAVLGVIDARGERDLRVALEQLAGGLTRPIAALRESLLDLLARLEAGLDFVEEDIEFIDVAEIRDQLAVASAQVESLRQRLSTRIRLDQSVRAVLVGPPNVGKSSLFNALVGGQALVSRQPGTTRDYLIAKIDLQDISCELVDTAGVESSGLELAAAQTSPASAEIARSAQDQTASQAEQAQIQLLCFESGQELKPWQRARLASFDPQAELLVLTKVDASAPFCTLEPQWATGAVETSAHSGSGLDTLRDRLRSLACSLIGHDSGAVNATTARAAESVRAAAEALVRASRLNAERRGEELVAAEIRSALAALGTVGGAVATNDLLDRIFSRFCIGK